MIYYINQYNMGDSLPGRQGFYARLLHVKDQGIGLQYWCTYPNLTCHPQQQWSKLFQH